MVENPRLYKKIALKDKIIRLRGLTIAQSARELEELVDFGWRFIKKKDRPIPVSLKHFFKNS